MDQASCSELAIRGIDETTGAFGMDRKVARMIQLLMWMELGEREREVMGIIDPDPHPTSKTG